MLFPFAEIGIPIIMVASGRSLSRFAAAPIRYIMRLSTFSMLAVLAAEPNAMPKSRSLKMQFGPSKSWPSFFGVFSNSVQFW